MNFMALIPATPECRINVVGPLKIVEMVAGLGRKLLGSPGCATVPDHGSAWAMWPKGDISITIPSL